MSSIPTITGTSASATEISRAVQNELGKEDFLRLLVTQLRYQDPLSPMENEAFIAQLAQFSSLEQMQNMNEKLEANMNSDLLMAQSISNSMVTTLIGHEVKVQSNQLNLGDEEVSVSFDVPQSMPGATVNIYDENGNLVYFEELGPVTAGEQEFTWNGRNNLGTRMPKGTYQIEVKLVDAEKNSTNVATFITGVVSSVKYGSDGAYLTVNDHLYRIGDVLEVRSAG